MDDKIYKMKIKRIKIIIIDIRHFNINNKQISVTKVI